MFSARRDVYPLKVLTMKRCVFLMLAFFVFGITATACNDDDDTKEEIEDTNQSCEDPENCDDDDDDAEKILQEAKDAFTKAQDSAIVLEARCPNIDVGATSLSLETFLDQFPKPFVEDPLAIAQMLNLYTEAIECYGDPEAQSTCIEPLGCEIQVESIEISVLALIFDWQKKRFAPHFERAETLYTDTILSCKDKITETPLNCNDTSNDPELHDADSALDLCTHHFEDLQFILAWDAGFQTDIASCIDAIEAYTECDLEEIVGCDGQGSDACDAALDVLYEICSEEVYF